MNVSVRREGTTLVTLHEGTDSTARRGARAKLSETLEALQSVSEPISDWQITNADVYEHPAAPFDPYTVTVTFSVTADVEASSPENAASIGATAIDAALGSTEIDGVSYTTAPSAVAT